MQKPALEVVWFKRDLRVFDHAPLVAANTQALARGSRLLPIYVQEHEYWQQPDTSERQHDFLLQSLQDLALALRAQGSQLVVRAGEVCEVLRALAAVGDIRALYSHEETGNRWTFERDLRVKAWCRAQGIVWHEFRQFGVVRGLRKRVQWARQWEQLMAQDCVPAPLLRPHGFLSQSERLFTEIQRNVNNRPQSSRLGCDGGRDAGLASMENFFQGRGLHYQRAMSSPLSAEFACSRLSAHLSLGTLSIREVLRSIQLKQAALTAAAAASGKAEPSEHGLWRKSLRSLTARLHWHCHFVQKLESEPQIEFCNINRGYDGMRESAINPDFHSRWSRGETGWPFVDACMRMLNATGWINFRMRAMLVSVASYQLWQHWRTTGLHLAQQFIDYEPGIHWSQMQMQSGVTGINIPRVYNPFKQGLDQDPNGQFIRRWLPELGQLPVQWIHQPWNLPGSLQRQHGVTLGRDYPYPMCDHEQAAREAKAKLTSWRAQPHMQALNREVLLKHGSKRRRVDHGARKDSPQLDLFASRLP